MQVFEGQVQWNLDAGGHAEQGRCGDGRRSDIGFQFFDVDALASQIGSNGMHDPFVIGARQLEPPGVVSGWRVARRVGDLQRDRHLAVGQSQQRSGQRVGAFGRDADQNHAGKFAAQAG